MFLENNWAQKIALGIGVEYLPNLQAALGWTVTLQEAGGALVYVYNPSTWEVKISEGTLDIPGLANTTLAALAFLSQFFCSAKNH